MWDFVGEKGLTDLVGDTARAGIVAAVCHGAAGLLATHRDENSVLSGRTATCFSNAEETLVGATAAVPFSLEDRVRRDGATYAAASPFQPHAVRDGNLITGQNPASSAAAAALVVGALRESQESLAP